MPHILRYRVLQLALSASVLLSSLLPGAGTRAYASTAQFEAALRGMNDEQLTAAFKSQSEKWGLLSILRELAVGAEPVTDQAVLEKSFDDYGDARETLPYWHYRSDIASHRPECKRFLETDLHINNKLSEELREVILDPSNRYYYQLRDRAWIELLNNSARNIDELVAEDKEGGEKPGCIPDEQEKCILPHCLTRLGPEWKARHAERAKLRELLVEQVIGSSGLWNDTHLLDELRIQQSQHKFEDFSLKWTTTTLDVGGQVMLFFIGYGEVLEAAKIWVGVERIRLARALTLLATGVVSYALNGHKAMASASMPFGSWEPALAVAEKYSDADWLTSKDLIAQLDQLTKQKIEAHRQLRFSPAIDQLVKDTMKSYGGEVEAYAQVPKILAKMALISNEMSHRGIAIPADFVSPISNRKENP